MKINEAGLDLIKRNEGCKLFAYQDMIGVWTIGFGHTGKDVTRGLTITDDQAEVLLLKDLERFESGVSDLLEVDVNENQFSALVSFAYNLGLGNLARSGLLKNVNKEDFKNAANSFLLWNKAGGHVVEGLTRRREEEKELFLTTVLTA